MATINLSLSIEEAGTIADILERVIDTMSLESEDCYRDNGNFILELNKNQMTTLTKTFRNLIK